MYFFAQKPDYEDVRHHYYISIIGQSNQKVYIFAATFKLRAMSGIRIQRVISLLNEKYGIKNSD
jgi:hypothetical protein